MYIYIHTMTVTRYAEEIMNKKYYSIVRYPIVDPKYIRGPK